MNDARLHWFRCYPEKLLGALGGMKPPEGYVYVIVLLRIYETNGPCRDSLDALATRTRMNRRVVSDALDSLFRSGRLIRNGDGIHNPKAVSEIEESKAFRQERKRAGEKGASRRWKKDEQNQQTGHGKANGEPLANDSHLQLHLEEEVRKKESKEGKGGRAVGAPLPLDWIPSQDEIHYGLKLGYSDTEIAGHAEDMRLWAKANANRPIARKIDWSSTFKGWLRREVIKSRPIARSAPRPGSREDRQERTANAYKKFSDFIEANEDASGPIREAHDGRLPLLKPPRS